MDPPMPASPTDIPDRKPSFRKPSNDATSRKYRRHSPDAASQSSSSHGSPRHQGSLSPPNSRNFPMIPDGDKRKDVEKEREESRRYHSNRGHGYQKYSDRQSYGNSEDYWRRDDRSNYDRQARSSRLDRDSRNDNHSDYARGERISSRYRDDWRTADNNFKEKGQSNDYRSKNREREFLSKNYEKPDTGSRHVGPDRDQGRENEYCADRRDRNRSPGSRNNHIASLEESRGHGKDTYRSKESDSPLWRKSERSSYKDVSREDQMQKRKREDCESDKNMDKQTIEQDLSQCKRTNFTAKNNSSIKLVPESEENKKTMPSMNATTNRTEDVNNVDQAKVAALKAAELVNKNLVGFGGPSFLSTDQKKKLLWGNKRNSSTEESSNRWDLNLFSDRDRQEKFNKLMGVKGNVTAVHQQEHKDGDVEVKKREELEMDLEKQYTAGLRRRDGRTVGLGL